jgi:hypothetical protein
VWTVLVVAILASPAGGAPAFSLRAQAGWSGWIPLGAWVPVRVELSSPDAVDGTVVVEVPVWEQGGVMSYRQPVRLAPGAPQRLTLDVIVPDARRVLIVRMIAQGRELARAEIPLTTAHAVEGVVLAVTREPTGLEHLSDLSRKIRPAYITEAELPVRWQGYAGVSLVVLHDLDARVVTPAQEHALDQWVAQGGRLVITGGEQLMRLRAPWLVQMLPATPVGLTFGPTQLPGVHGPIASAVLSARGGAVMRGPLRAQWQWGAGSVTVWAFDALAPELRTWAGQSALWEEALNAPVRPWLVSRDLLRILPTSRPLPAGVQAWLAALAVVYIVAARAALRRAGRLRAGWLLVPALAAAFGPVMYGFALQARHIGTVAVQAVVVEAIPDMEVARVRTVVALLSPYGGVFELTAPGGASLQPVEPRPLIFNGPATVSGQAPASGLQLDVMQVVSTPAQGRLIADPDGQRVEITLGSVQTIDEPLLVRRGQIYRLPRIAAALSAHLDATRWEPFTPLPSPPLNLADRLRQEVLARLSRQAAGADVTTWLVGRIDDPQLSLRGRPMSTEVHQLVVIPLRAQEGPP